MQQSSTLGQLVLGYSPMINRERTVVATRLTVFPERRDAAPDVAGLLRALDAVWPSQSSAGEGISLTLRPLSAAGGASPPTPAPRAPGADHPLSLNVASESWLRALMAAQPPPHIMLEVPAFMVGDPANAATLAALHEAGSVLIVKGRPASELPRALLPCFRHSLIDVGEDRRSEAAPPAGAVRHITHIQVGVRSVADIEAAFARGAVAVLGWPFGDEVAATGASRSGGPDLQVVTELMKRVDREESIDRLEAVIRNDPQLGFRLIRYLNSAAFGLPVQISSFQHALMMLGYKKLKRWLALLLVSASKDPAMKPAMFAAVRRGMLMEELAGAGADDEMRGEMFICGVFSLLDRMMGQSFAKLFESVPVPERVQQALTTGTGPYHPFLSLVLALEQGARSDIREAADASFLGLAEVNAALLSALAKAREMD
jgi:EAL and modified HD-GYP domain-containing signal transduction protein